MNIDIERLRKECRFTDKDVRILSKYEVKPKQNELDKLFIGAPVFCSLCSYTDHIRMFNYGNIPINYHQTPIRLPTVEEAPRNVWLAPWLEMPEELYNLKVLLWGTNDDIKLYSKGRCEPNNIAWENVEAIMILEGFNK